MNNRKKRRKSQKMMALFSQMSLWWMSGTGTKGDKKGKCFSKSWLLTRSKRRSNSELASNLKMEQ
jgi:hypothetical protein